MSAPYLNIWGHKIPLPQQVLCNKRLYKHIIGFFSNILPLIGLSEEETSRFIANALKSADIETGLDKFEQMLKASLDGKINSRAMAEATKRRAEIVNEEIKDFVSGHSLLDVGCGNGLISKLLKGRFDENQIHLLDVVNYVDPTVKLQFSLYQEGASFPINQLYDTVLVLTVLHHANDPVRLLNLAWEAAKSRLIVIESVIGVHQVPPTARYELTDASDEDQIAYAAFIDWFYNRILHDNIPVPYNFTSPERWESVFRQSKMKLIHKAILGQDIEIGPELHVLFVLERQN